MDTVVYVEAWQLQCCGEPFKVGDTVEWNCSDSVDREFLAMILGDAGADKVTHVEDHHDVAGPLSPLTGRVTGIASVSCSTEVQGDLRVPVVGGAQVTQISSANGWESEPTTEWVPEGSDKIPHFYGYVVRIYTSASGSP